MLIENHGFKTIQIAVFFAQHETKDTRVYRFLLPKLITAQTDHFDSRAKMNEALEHLYGAYFKTRIERMGDLNIMSITLTIVDPKIVSDDLLFKDALSLMHALFNRQKGLDEATLEEEKRMLLEQWATYKDNKRLFAQHRFNTHFFKNDLYASPVSGTPSEIKKVTIEKMNDYFQSVLKNDHIHVIVNGRVDESHMLEIHQKLFKDDMKQISFELKFRKPRKHFIIEEKTQNLQQAILKIGYLLPVFRNDALFDAAVLIDIMLGGYPESRLFKDIREKMGLCYDISSNYDQYKGVLTLSAGVKMDQKQEAHDAIVDLIFKTIQHGFESDEIMHAKAYYKSQIKSSLDQQSFLTRRAYTRLLFNHIDTIEERLKAIDQVSEKDINEVIQLLTLDTSYILVGEEHA